MSAGTFATPLAIAATRALRAGVWTNITIGTILAGWLVLSLILIGRHRSHRLGLCFLAGEAIVLVALAFLRNVRV